jgi:hypothetical protein
MKIASYEGNQVFIELDVPREISLQVVCTESDYRQEFRKSSWAACIRFRPCGNYGVQVKRIYEIAPLACPP